MVLNIWARGRMVKHFSRRVGDAGSESRTVRFLDWFRYANLH